jgi:hypothetical protein
MDNSTSPTPPTFIDLNGNEVVLSSDRAVPFLETFQPPPDFISTAEGYYG